ncbi:MAG: efflux RND transporter periplasmic adaptor subunit [Chitinophagaceae bacterium]
MKHSNLINLAWIHTLLFTLVLFTGCFSTDKTTSLPPEVSAVSPETPVDGIIIQPSILKEELEITGTLVANQQVDIVSELTRKIVQVTVKEGSVVRAGDLLFQMDDADLQAQLEKLRQQEKLAVLNEERLKELITHEAVVQQDYDQSFTNLKVLQAQVAELQVMIAKTRIKAPFSGRIGIIHVYPGAVVSMNTILTNLQDNSLVKVEFSIPEKYAAIITAGSEQKFSVASDAKQYAAKVVAREASVDQNTRTLLIRAVSPNPGGILIPGQSARLNLSLHASNSALMLSSQAMMPSSKGYSVYVSRNNKAQPVAIGIGQRNSDAVEIVQGLKAGDTVITSNLLRLVPGTSIKFITLK